MNIELQQLLNPPGTVKVERFGWTFTPGDKVMQVVNDYDKEVFNGDLGRVRTIDLEAGELVAEFDGREVPYDFGELDELVLAYATTVHKAQGSEYPAVVIPVTTQHYPMLQRNLLYTAVTRGRQLVVLVAQPKAVAIAVKGQLERRRWSKLQEWLAAPAQTPGARCSRMRLERSCAAMIGPDHARAARADAHRVLRFMARVVHLTGCKERQAQGRMHGRSEPAAGTVWT